MFLVVVPNLATNISKKSIDRGGIRLNQLRISLFRDVGNMEHSTMSFVVYRIIWVM